MNNNDYINNDYVADEMKNDLIDSLLDETFDDMPFEALTELYDRLWEGHPIQVSVSVHSGDIQVSRIFTFQRGHK